MTAGARPHPGSPVRRPARPSARRALLGVLAAAAVVALALPAAASAHAILGESNPSPGQRLPATPRAIELHFNGPLKVLPNSIQVLSTTGQVFSGPPRLGADNRTLVADLLELPKGGYTLRWRTLSALDGHLVSGVYTFGVRYPAPPATAAYGTTGAGSDEQAVRWLYFLALAFLGGGLAFRLVVLRGLAVPPRLSRTVTIFTGVAVVLGIEVGIVGFLLRASNVLQVPFSDFFYGDVSPLANGTRFGAAFIALTLGLVVVSALIVLSWLNDRDWPLWPALALTLGLSSGLSFSGHSASGPDAWASVLADYVHLVAVQLWVGGLATMAICLWWTAPELRRVAFLRFSKLATVLVALVVGAGIYLTYRRLTAVTDLWETTYGNVLIVKLLLVALALVWGGFHHTFVRPVVARPGRDGFVGRLQRSLLGEGAVVAAVLLLAAILVNSEPPVPKQSSRPAAAAGAAAVPPARPAAASAQVRR